jgi:DNA processing protein
VKSLVLTLIQIKYAEISSMSNFTSLGNLELLKQTQKNIAVVGARRASVFSQNICSELIKYLSRFQCNIVSGLAYGIDSSAHKSALDNGLNTIAVLGCGINNFPEQTGNPSLARRIQNHPTSLIISQFEPDCPASRYSFPLRNKTIAEISFCIIVIQAGADSGSLITATWAQKLSKKIFVIPGQFLSESFSGNNFLLSNKLAEPILDLENLGSLLELTPKSPKAVQCALLSPIAQTILASLSLEPINIEELIQKTALDYALISKQLSLLEIQGIVKRSPGMLFSRKS